MKQWKKVFKLTDKNVNVNKENVIVYFELDDCRRMCVGKKELVSKGKVRKQAICDRQQSLHKKYLEINPQHRIS